MCRSDVQAQVSQLRGRVINEHPDGSEAGIWECTPGTWTRQVMDAEISNFVKGHALFHPDDGEAIEISAGDTVYFDENSKGTWEVLETVRKAVDLHPILPSLCMQEMPHPSVAQSNTVKQSDCCSRGNSECKNILFWFKFRCKCTPKRSFPTSSPTAL